MFDFMIVAKALTDESRVRIIMALRHHELCVCQMTGLLDLAPSTTSKHLTILRQARLIESRKKGKWVYYALADASTAPVYVQKAFDWLFSSLASSPSIMHDQVRIEQLHKEHMALEGQEGEPCADKYHSLEIHALDDTELPVR